MSWVAISLVSAGVSALVSIFDKTIIYRYARSPRTLPLLIGLAQTGVGLGVLAIVRMPNGATAAGSGAAFLSGVLFGLGGQLLLRVLYTQEVSRTIPVIQSAPLFTAIIAMVFLRESISTVQWLGVVASVAGSVLLSLRFDGGVRSMFLHSSFFLLMLAAALMGVANVIGKIALETLPVLYTHGLRMLAIGVVFLLFNSRSAPWGDVRDYFAQRSPALLLVGVNELVIANSGLLLMLWALSEGPVSLVTALAGTRALFVVLYSTCLALVWRGALGEQTSRGAVVLKVGATLLIVAGVGGIVA